MKLIIGVLFFIGAAASVVAFAGSTTIFIYAIYKAFTVSLLKGGLYVLIAMAWHILVVSIGAASVGLGTFLGLAVKLKEENSHP